MLVYTTINHAKRKELRLTCNEYILLDMVYQLQINPSSVNPGWCYMKRQSMADELGVSKQTILNLIDKLILLGYIERNEVTRNIKTLPKWHNIYFLDAKKEGKESLPEAKKDEKKGKESLPVEVKNLYPEGKETLPYININNNINKIQESAQKNFLEANSEKKENFGGGEKLTFSPPTLEVVIEEFAKHKMGAETARLFYNKHEATGWAGIVKWHNLVQNWKIRGQQFEERDKIRGNRANERSQISVKKFDNSLQISELLKKQQAQA